MCKDVPDKTQGGLTMLSSSISVCISLSMYIPEIANYVRLVGETSAVGYHKYDVFFTMLNAVSPLSLYVH